jgi:hypothetical protein
MQERRISVARPKKKTSASASETSSAIECQEGSTLEHCAAEASETGSVDKIRDIIFGNQMRDYDTRFVRLEKQVFKEIADLRDETIKRLDSIEGFIKKEIESFSERLKSEQQHSADRHRKLSKELKDTNRTISKNIERLDEKQSKDARELRQQLLDQSKDLGNAIRQKYNESSKALETSFQELRQEKIDRLLLSELLMEMAIRMSDELAEKLNLQRDD